MAQWLEHGARIPQTTQLNDRAQHLLHVLVESYIRDGQPVGSRTLSRDSGLNLSAATIRNVMADLEELGFVSSPHTSAGRVPTDKGYRFFVDTLLKLPAARRADDVVDELQRRLDERTAAIRRRWSPSPRRCCRRHAPRGRRDGAAPDAAALSQIEFVPLSDNRVLAILVVNGRDVQNRILQLERYYSADELRRAANYPQSAVRAARS